MKKQIRNLLLFTAMTMMALPPQAVQACAFGMESYFTFTTHPDFPLSKYAAGQLGILQSNYARSYLLTAYRYLEGKPLTAAEQKDVVALWESRLNAGDWNGTVDTKPWETARAAVPGVGKLASDIWTDKAVDSDEAYNQFCNCQQGAFTHAIDTLKALSTKYGASNPEVKDWVLAQDAVFSNCGTPAYSDKKPVPQMPKPLPASADPAFQHERAYQIAAANFYAQNYDVAIEEFNKIAADASSPYKNIAPYLAVRAMVRKATLQKTEDNALLEKAAERLKQLAVEPSYAAMAKDLGDLGSFIAARITPEQHLIALTSQPFTQGTLGEMTKTIDRLVGDDEMSDTASSADKYSKQPAALHANDMIDWVLAFEAGEDKTATQHAIAQWKKLHTTPWLVAAAASVDPADPQADAIASAAMKDTTPAAKWELFFDANRINLGKDRDAQVRDGLDKVLNNPPADLPLGSLNALKLQRLELARNLGEFIRFGYQQPLCNCSDGMVEQVPDDITKGPDLAVVKPEFAPEAGQAIQIQMPLAVLKDIGTSTKLSSAMRNTVLWTSWVRAVLIGDDAAAKDFATLVKPYNKAKSKYFDAYLAAATPEDKKFAAANLMLHFSSAVPVSSFGEMSDDSYGDAAGWWWGKPAVSKPSVGYGEGQEIDELPLEFLTAAQTAQAKAQVAKLEKVDAAPNWFAKIVLPYAKAHPADPRVPEALAWLVKATHYGSTDDQSKIYSKQAFTILHTKYKTNPWTRKTPYYY